MVGTPYALLAAFGFFVYRGFKKISQAEAARDQEDTTPPSDPRV